MIDPRPPHKGNYIELHIPLPLSIYISYIFLWLLLLLLFCRGVTEELWWFLCTTHLRESNQRSDGENQKYRVRSLPLFLHWFNQLYNPVGNYRTAATKLRPMTPEVRHRASTDTYAFIISDDMFKSSIFLLSKIHFLWTSMSVWNRGEKRRKR